MKATDRGSASLELVLLTPVLVVVLLFVVAGGRIAAARGQLDGVVRDAARAGSLARSPTAAEKAANELAAGRLATAGLTCRDLNVDVDTSRFYPGGSISARITCTVDLSDLLSLRVPGSRVLVADATEPIDGYRGIVPAQGSP